MQTMSPWQCPVGEKLYANILEIIKRLAYVRGANDVNMVKKTEKGI